MSCCEKIINNSCNCYNCCKVCSVNDIKNINNDYSIDFISFIPLPSLSESIKQYFTYNPFDLYSLLVFYNKILKAEKYGTVQAIVGWTSIKKGEIICGDMCCFKEALKDRGNFYATINAAIEYNKWLTKKKMYEKRGLHYCMSFVYKVSSSVPHNLANSSLIILTSID